MEVAWSRARGDRPVPHTPASPAAKLQGIAGTHSSEMDAHYQSISCFGKCRPHTPRAGRTTDPLIRLDADTAACPDPECCYHTSRPSPCSTLLHHSPSPSSRTLPWIHTVCHQGLLFLSLLRAFDSEVS